MAKAMNDAFADQALEWLTSSVTMTVCNEQPMTFASATTQGGNMLAKVTVSGGDFTIADGDASGRKVSIAQRTGIPVSATGGGNHVALVDASVLRYVTTATSQNLTAGNTLTINGFDIEIADPS